MWMTVNLLVARECRKTHRDIADELKEWLESVATSAQSEIKENEEKGRVFCDTPTSTGVPELPREKKKKKKAHVIKKPEFLQTVVSFSHPHVRSRLEKLMGSNIVRLTDREYMHKLQERIYEDHLEMQRRRIEAREAQEVEREKKLILEGKLPIEEASKELMEHPVFKVSQLTKKIIEEKRSKIKPALSVVSSYFYGAEEVAAAKEAEAVLGITAGRRTSEESREDREKECRLEDDLTYMFTQEEYEKLKYESPLVKQLRTLETVDEMYALADEIIGPLKTMKRGQHCAKNK